MIKIFVKDNVTDNDALIYPQGERLYEKIRPMLFQGKKVELSFEGIRDVLPAFLSGCIGRLYISSRNRFENGDFVVSDFEHIPYLDEDIFECIRRAKNYKFFDKLLHDAIENDEPVF